jgi:hypothetical protein
MLFVSLLAAYTAARVAGAHDGEAVLESGKTLEKAAEIRSRRWRLGERTR